MNLRLCAELVPNRFIDLHHRNVYSNSLYHMERMSENCRQRGMNASVNGRIWKRRPKFGCMGGVMIALSKKEESMKCTRLCTINEDEWKEIVNTQL